MSMTIGDVLMNATVNGTDVEVTAGLLLHGAMADTFNANVDAKQANIGQLDLRDTAEALTSAKKNNTRGAYERSKSKSWKKKKLGHKSVRVTVTDTSKKMSNAEFENNRDHCEKKSDTECSGCRGFRRAAYEYFSGGKEGKHPSRDDHKCLVHRA